MLLLIRDFLRRERIVSNQQIAREFGLDITAVEPMLEFWIQKGIIGFCQRKPACQSPCFKCQTRSLVYYEYQED